MHTVLYGVASQTLSHVPPERVTSATYVIEDLLYDVDDTANRVIASGSATVDDLSLTLDAAAGPSKADPRKIPVSATTGAAEGDPVVVRSVDGHWEHARIRGVVADDYVTVDHPLVGEYASGDALYGTLVSATVPAGVYDDEDLLEQERELRVVWKYSIGGQTVWTQEPIFVRRQRDGMAYQAAAIERFRDAYPDLAEQLPTGTTLSAWAKFAVEDLRSRLMARNIEPAQFLAGERGLQALTYRIVMHAAEHGLSPGTMPADIFLDRVREHFEHHFGSLTTGEAGKGVVEVTRSDEFAVRSEKHRMPWGVL